MRLALIILLLTALGASAQKLPTVGLRQSNVEAVIGDTRLSLLFTNSTDSYFDITYKGSKDRLSNFRNYGPTISAPSVTTTSSTSTGCTTTSVAGNVTADGGATVTARGFCYSTSANPTLADTYTTNGSGTGSFGVTISSLDVTIGYHLRAYATNSAGTAYGEDIEMRTALDIYPYAELVSVFVGTPSDYLDITWTETNPTLSTDDIIIRIQNVTKSSGWIQATSNNILSGQCQVSRFESISMGVTNEAGDYFDIELSSDGGLTWFTRMFITQVKTLPYDINQ